jgi:thioredoxin-related protein
MIRLLATIAGLVLLAVPAAAAELLMLRQPGCAWCQRFEAEIGEAYSKTTEGAVAPLRRIDISRPWPEDLAAVTPERFTPTFVLVNDGQEVARLRGYPGDQFFWYLIDDMLTKLPASTQADHSPSG